MKTTIVHIDSSTLGRPVAQKCLVRHGELYGVTGIGEDEALMAYDSVAGHFSRVLPQTMTHRQWLRAIADCKKVKAAW